MIQKYVMRPFWPEKMLEADKAARMSEFQRAIFPIWKPIVQAWEKTWDEPKSKDEMLVVHDIDNRIWESGLKVNRSQGVSVEAMRRGDSMRSKMAQVYE